MPCALTSSLSLDCRNAIGGIIEIKVKVHPGLATVTADFTETSGVVAIATGSRTGWYLYACEKNTASLSESVNSNVQQGTVFYQQELKLIFNKLTTKMRNELKVLAQNSLLFAIKDQNSEHWLIGHEFGADLTGGTSATGTGKGDRSGYDLTFQAQERAPMLEMTLATYDTLDTA